MVKLQVTKLILQTSSGSIYELFPEDGSSKPMWLVKKSNVIQGVLLCFGKLSRVGGKFNDATDQKRSKYVDMFNGDITEIIHLAMKNPNVLVGQQILYTSVPNFKKLKESLPALANKQMAALGKSVLTDDLLKSIGYSTSIVNISTLR